MSKLPPEDICNENTFNNIYLKYSKTLFSFIYYRCGDEDQAQDLVQESFFKLWGNCSNVSHDKVKSYLYTTVNNLFLNDIRAKKIALKYANDSLETNYESPEFILEQEQYQMKLDMVLNSLTEEQRTAFLLNRIDGKKYSEIAEIYNISVKAVEKRIHKALKTIKEQLGEIKI